MAFKLETSCAERSFCFVAILICLFGARLRAQTSAENDRYPFSSSVPSLSLCGQSADSCSQSSAVPGQNDSNQHDAGGGNSHQQDDWVTKWLSSVDKARSEQPHYVAPLVTTHVLLVQQYRYDSSWQANSDRTQTDNYGNGRGLEIIPNTRMEVQIAPPPYIVHSGSTTDGNGDTALFVKFRAFSASEGEGDYFVGLFLGASFPSGSPPNGSGHTVLSPMLALAKGWGRFNIQNTLSGSVPTSGTNVLGRAFLWNTTFQYGIKGKIWPMIEQNSTFFSDGPDSGKKETFLTPGIVFGMFQVAERLRFGIGGGVQIAATQFHQYNHRWILSVRFPF
jgi:hypothetical protein